MPTRKCAVCNRRGEQRDFLRFVLPSDTLVFDEKQVLDGRGAYLHKHENCIFAPSVFSLLMASLSKNKLVKKGKKQDESELIKEVLGNWAGLEKVLSSFNSKKIMSTSQSKIRL